MSNPVGPIVNVSDVLEIKVVTYANPVSQIGINVRHYLVATTDVEDIGLGDCAREVATYIEAEYKDLLSDEADFLGTTARRVTPNPTDSLSSNAGEGAGLRTGGLLPAQTTGIITMTTNLPGRAGRGRVYVPFPAEEDSSAGIPGGNYFAQLGPLGTKFTDTITVTTTDTLGQGTIAPILWHAALQNFDPIFGFIARQKWATQRSRSQYGALNPKPAL